MDTYWVPGVNNLATFGRWAFAELTDKNRFKEDLERAIDTALEAAISSGAPGD
jgi:type III restriction enzyme